MYSEYIINSQVVSSMSVCLWLSDSVWQATHQPITDIDCETAEVGVTWLREIQVGMATSDRWARSRSR